MNAAAKINLALARSLGLETKNLRSFRLVVEPGALPVVYANYLVRDEGPLAETARSFRLQPLTIDEPMALAPGADATTLKDVARMRVTGRIGDLPGSDA